MNEVSKLHVVVSASHASLKHTVAHVGQVFDHILLHELGRLLERFHVVAEAVHHDFQIILKPVAIPLGWWWPFPPGRRLALLIGQQVLIMVGGVGQVVISLVVVIVVV